VGAGRDLVEPQVNGIVVPASNAAALTAALRRIIDDAPRKAMTAAARRAAARWDLAEGVARWREAARFVLAARLAA
jgi:glycosyltransferase involved in cell wall biosynthesis